MLSTRKLYFEDMFLTSTDATILHIDNRKGIILDKTVAYPEGGGQVSDIGTIKIGEQEVVFLNCQKGIGHMLYVDDFPVIQIDSPIYHMLHENDYARFNIGDSVTMSIDIHHRIKTSIMHTATHIALMAVDQVFPGARSQIKGCKITDTTARLDFHISDKLTPQHIEEINHIANAIVTENREVLLFPHPQSQEAWYWQCKDFVIPCGGTHVSHSGCVGSITVKRKGLGKGTERITITAQHDQLEIISKMYDR